MLPWSICGGTPCCENGRRAGRYHLRRGAACRSRACQASGKCGKGDCCAAAGFGGPLSLHGNVCRLGTPFKKLRQRIRAGIGIVPKSAVHDCNYLRQAGEIPSLTRLFNTSVSSRRRYFREQYFLSGQDIAASGCRTKVLRYPCSVSGCNGSASHYPISCKTTVH